MHGITTALVGFIFACVVWPQLVRNRPQFHAGLILVLLIILLDAAAMVAAASPAFRTFAYAMIALLQIGAILMLFFSSGGVTPRDVLGGIAGAFEVIRRGETEKEVIIPLSGQKGAPRREAEDDAGEEGRIVYEINDPALADRPKPAAPPPEKREENKGPLPME
jgi:hypothetical protein